MFKRFFTTFVCAAALTLAGCGGGTNILNVQSRYTVHSGNVNLDNVTRTIITACATKGWKPSIAGPGDIIATRHSSGHVAKVEIVYTNESFNIQYLDSDNMGYDGKHISSIYSQWVEELQSEIKFRLSEL